MILCAGGQKPKIANPVEIVVGYVCREQTHKLIKSAASSNPSFVLCVLGDELHPLVSDTPNAPIRDRRTPHVPRCIPEKVCFRDYLVEPDDPITMAFTAVSG